MSVETFRDLRVYQLGFEAAMQVYELSKRWPREEKHSLVDQIRRSSRSVCTCTAEAWGKRRYQAHFVSKLSDADMELCETRSWLDFALECRYITEAVFQDLESRYARVGGGLVRMMADPEKWCFRADRIMEERATYDVEEEL